MASSRIYQDDKIVAASFSEKKYPLSRIIDFDRVLRFIEMVPSIKSPRSKQYPITKLSDGDRETRIDFDLPFKVKFINIGIESYGPNNPPPIGIAVIGFNNYIL